MTMTNVSMFVHQFKLTVQKMGVVSHLCSALSQLTRVLPEKVTEPIVQSENVAFLG